MDLHNYPTLRWIILNIGQVGAIIKVIAITVKQNIDYNKVENIR
jgi:hypothetical protein